MLGLQGGLCIIAKGTVRYQYQYQYPVLYKACQNRDQQQHLFFRVGWRSTRMTHICCLALPLCSVERRRFGLGSCTMALSVSQALAHYHTTSTTCQYCTRQRCASYESQKGKCLLAEVNALMRSLSLVEGGAVAYVQTTCSCPSSITLVQNQRS